MAIFEHGTYSGSAEGLSFEFRVEQRSMTEIRAVSGDIIAGADFVASFICDEPKLMEEGRTLTGALAFRGNPELFSGSLYLNADERGIGTFQVVVDLEGGHRDVFAGKLESRGGFLRRLQIEIDGIDGAQPPKNYGTRGGSIMTIERAFEQAGFDVTVIVDPFRGGPAKGRARGYTHAEIHTAMEEKRRLIPADRLHAHVFVCSYLNAGPDSRNVLGVMYDFEDYDLNRQPREGVAVFYDHPMLSDPRVPDEERNREYVFTLIHEIGHALNLMHSFDKARPASLSWMNYPHLYPRGTEAESDYDGTQEFWRRFSEQFDDDELFHLRHATPREIRAGGFEFGVYEEGVSGPFGGPATPRRTRLGANPLRTLRPVTLRAEPIKPEYQLGEPVFLKIEVKNNGLESVWIPGALDPTDGYVRLTIRTPAGHTIRYRPPITLCRQAQLIRLTPGQESKPFDSVPIFLSGRGPVLTEPGIYRISAELVGVNGYFNVYSTPRAIRILSPDKTTEEVAVKLWTSPDALKALYLRHPLVAIDVWNELDELIQRAPLSRDNTLQSYFNYIGALGWMYPFATLSKREYPSDIERASARMLKVDPKGLPSSASERKANCIKAKEEGGKRRTGRARTSVIATRVEEKARAEVPPGGLFGGLGLEPERRTDPFERVVPRLRGTRTFADVVSWNIEHLHSRTDKIPKVAELIRSFRCDFWGLQEVDAEALTELLHTLNSRGRTRYAGMAVAGRGQQSAVLFRTDTTSVKDLAAPEGFFDNRITVKLRKEGSKTRDVFLRKPLLCDVSVQQKGTGSFDFRCAVVHLKSTDTELKDTGSGMRRAAAKELARWIEFEWEHGTEKDYLILGDMNAETAEQGLAPFASKEDLKLLSIGMQDKYGKAEALTRVASERLLDHIVVTNEAQAIMPKEDEKEQIIIRSDTIISDWIEEYSDHIPVAVRFVLGRDAD